MKKIRTTSINRWNKLIKKRYPDLYNDQGNSEKLRLILGVGRSGTSWLGKTLSHTETPIRYVHEAYPHMRTKFITNTKGDPQALPFMHTLTEKHPYLAINKMLCSNYLAYDFFLDGYMNRKLPRSDENFQVVIHKIVHGLLASKALLSSLSCPTVIVTRNPIYVIDSLLAYQDISTPIWRKEQELMHNDTFLNLYFPDNKNKILHYLNKYPDNGSSRRKVIIGKSLSVALLNSFLKQLGEQYPYTCTVSYEELCKKPSVVFSEIADFFNLKFHEESKHFLNSTMEMDDSNNHNSIFRDTKKQIGRPYKSLSINESETIEHVLNDCGLFK